MDNTGFRSVSIPLAVGIYREDFYFVDRFHSSALHGDWCTTGYEAHMNFANDSACLMANNFWNEVKVKVSLLKAVDAQRVARG
jgi:hypothetical protein